LDEQDFNFTEFNGRWQWNPGRNTNVTLSAFTQSDAFAFDFDLTPGPAPPLNFFNSISSQNDGISFTLNQDIKSNKNVRFQAAYTKQGNSSEEGVSFFFDELSYRRESSIVDASIRLDFTQSIAERHQLKLGLQAQQMESFFFLGENNGFETLTIAEQSTEESLSLISYAAFSWQPTRPVRADLGLRAVYYTPTGAFYPEPRLTASYHLNPNLTIKTGFGINHQFFNEIVELDEDGFSVTTPLWALADGDEFTVPSARELTLGILWKKKGWLLDIEAYNKSVNNLSSVNLINQVDLDRFASGSSRSIGIDFLLKKRYQKLTSWGIYTLSKSDWSFPDAFNNEEAFFPAQNDVRHRFKWVTSYQTNRWLLSL
ncbi:MAG: TonB-dependent receptor, partial [Bacteroidota bacterium]